MEAKYDNLEFVFMLFTSKAQVISEKRKYTPFSREQIQEDSKWEVEN